MNKRNCPSCEQNNQSSNDFLLKKDEWLLKACKNCNFVYLENYATYEELKDDYAWEKTSVVESSERKESEPFVYFLSTLFKRFKTHVLKRNKISYLFKRHYLEGKVLDIGCSDGGLISDLRRNTGKSFIPMGIEISTQLAKAGDANLKQFGGEVIHANAIDGLAQLIPGTLSMIIMSSFLEHELCPSECLKNAHQALQTGGRIIIKVPNYDCLNRKFRKEKWCGYRFPDHLNYFTPTTMSKMATKNNFTVRQYNLFDRFPTSDNMYVVLEKS